MPHDLTSPLLLVVGSLNGKPVFVSGGTDAHTHAPVAGVASALLSSFEQQHEGPISAAAGGGGGGDDSSDATPPGALRYARVGDVALAFLKRGVLWYVCAHDASLPLPAHRCLALVHAALLMQLTNQFEVIAARKPTFDVSRTLDGLAPSIDGLWRSTCRDPGWHTGTFAVAPVPSATVRRRLIASLSGARSDAAAERLVAAAPRAPEDAGSIALLRAALLESSGEDDDASLALGLLVDSRTGGVLALAQNPRMCGRGKKLGWHPDDVQLVCHHVAGMRWRLDAETSGVHHEQPTEFRDPLRDHLMPICLPYTLGPNAYAHALVAFLPASGGDGNDVDGGGSHGEGVVLVLVSTDAASFPALRRRRLYVHAALEAPMDGASGLSNAFDELWGRRRGAQATSCLENGMGMYVRPTIDQHFLVSAGDYVGEEAASALMAARRMMKDPIERGANAPSDALRRADPERADGPPGADPMRVVWNVDSKTCALACVGEGFEATIVLPPSTEQATAVALCNRFVAWAKAEERRSLLAPAALSDAGALAPNGAVLWE